MTITVTEEDLKTLEAIPAAFMNNVLSNSGMTREEAYDAYVKSLSKMEMAGLAASKLKLQFSKSAAPETKAKRIVEFCDKAVPGLTKVFGEQALVDGFPESAKTEHMADLTEQLGGSKIANLIRKSL